MENEGSLLYSQETATCLYPESSSGRGKKQQQMLSLSWRKFTKSCLL